MNFTKPLSSCTFLQRSFSFVAACILAAMIVSPASAQLVINEVDYDQPGSDIAEFIELKNNGASAVDLTTYSVQLINGSTISSYANYALPSVMLAAGDYFVICMDSNTVPNCDLEVTGSIQNGAPDAIALLNSGVIVDALSYEGDVAGYVEGSGSGLNDIGSTGFDKLGLSRSPDGADTDNNNADFSFKCITPGEENTADSVDCTPPANDLCANAIAINCGDSVAGRTKNATFDDAGFCGTGNSSPGVWYSLTGTGGDVTISTCNNADFDTKISVFTGSCGALVCETGNDDFSGCSGFTSSLTLSSLDGTEYLVLVHGFQSNEGYFTLSVDCAPPANDSCSGAMSIACGDTVLGSNAAATPDGGSNCGTTPGSNGVWYMFTGDGAPYTASLCGSDYDTKINIYEGSCDSLICVGGNDDFCSLQSETIFNTDAGTTYYILVNGFGTSTGNYQLSFSCGIFGCTDSTATNYNADATIEDGSCAYAPANDLCADAMSAACGDTIMGTTTGATFDSVGTCGISNTAPGVWYSITGDGSDITASLCGSSYDTKLSVFSGVCAAPVCVDGNDDDCSFQSSVTFSSSVGETYWVLVHGFSSNTGDFMLTFDCAPPANDSCSGAMSIACGDTVLGSNAAATPDGGSNCGTTPGSNGVWYMFTGDGAPYTASLCGSDYDTKINIYEGSCESLICVGGSDDFCSLQSETIFNTDAGTTYYILVNGFGTSTGNYQLALSCGVLGCTDSTATNYDANATIDDGSCSFAPANDLCAGAFSASCGDTIMGTTNGATLDTADFCGASNTAPGVWYVITGDGSDVTASLCGSSYDTKISVFSGACTAPVCVDGNDDDCGLQSSVTFSTMSGEDYWVLVHGFLSRSGDFMLTIDCAAPANDECSGAFSIACGDTVMGSTGASTLDSMLFCGTENSSPGVWYVFTGDGSAVTASLCGSSYDTRVSIYEGACGTLNCVAGNDDACSLQSEISFNSVAGTDYYILAHGWNSNTGNYELALSCEAPCTPAVTNDDCASAMALTIGSGSACTPTSGTNICASSATGTPPSCDEFGVIQDVWYSFNSGANTSVYLTLAEVTATGLGYAVYDACGGTEVACDDFNAATSNLVSGLTASTDYWIQIWTSGSDEGEFTICLSETEPCGPVDGLDAPLVRTGFADLTWNCDSNSSYVLQGNEVGRNNPVSLAIPAGCALPYRVSGLESGTEYWWQVKQVCSDGSEGPWSSIDTFATQCDIPDSTWTTNITSNGAVLNWTSVSGANGYEIRGRRVGGVYVTLLVSGGNNTSRDVTGALQPNTTYEWQVRSRCAVGGFSTRTSLIQFTTASSAKMQASNGLDQLDLNVYPNPASSAFNIKLEGSLIDADLNLKVVDLSGREFFNSDVNSFELMNAYQVDASQWSEGMYQLIVSGKDGFRMVKKVTITH